MRALTESHLASSSSVERGVSDCAPVFGIALRRTYILAVHCLKVRASRRGRRPRRGHRRRGHFVRASYGAVSLLFSRPLAAHGREAQSRGLLDWRRVTQRMMLCSVGRWVRIDTAARRLRFGAPAALLHSRTCALDWWESQGRGREVVKRGGPEASWALRACGRARCRPGRDARALLSKADLACGLACAAATTTTTTTTNRELRARVRKREFHDQAALSH